MNKVCSNCQKGFFPGTVSVPVMADEYHTSCLYCNKCGSLLWNKSFIKKKDGRLYCEEGCIELNTLTLPSIVNNNNSINAQTNNSLSPRNFLGTQIPNGKSIYSQSRNPNKNDSMKGILNHNYPPSLSSFNLNQTKNSNFGDLSASSNALNQISNRDFQNSFDPYAAFIQGTSGGGGKFPMENKNLNSNSNDMLKMNKSMEMPSMNLSNDLNINSYNQISNRGNQNTFDPYVAFINGTSGKGGKIPIEMKNLNSNSNDLFKMKKSNEVPSINPNNDSNNSSFNKISNRENQNTFDPYVAFINGTNGKGLQNPIERKNLNSDSKNALDAVNLNIKKNEGYNKSNSSKSDDYSFVVCDKCNEPITSEKYSFNKMDFHKNCYTCNNCNTELFRMKKVLKDNNGNGMYCEPCFAKLFGPKCAKCEQPVTPYMLSTLNDNKLYHKECFICGRCKKSLIDKKFNKVGKINICKDCF